ncbi:MAG: flagellar hook-basal body complex protein FliE [Candidatus Schekmanbacteria bacterium]|nr:flagellar hook-basal body complex protein FliE [Candidatus Schekmanbacteria bacterium]
MRIEDFNIGRPLTLPLGPETAAKPAGSLAAPPDPNRPTFGDTLKSAIREVNEVKQEAEEAVRKLATGESSDIHGAMIAVKKADVQFQMMMQARNKLVEAYRQVMQTGI